MLPTLHPANQTSAENISSAWNTKLNLSSKKAMLDLRSFLPGYLTWHSTSWRGGPSLCISMGPWANVNSEFPLYWWAFLFIYQVLCLPNTYHRAWNRVVPADGVPVIFGCCWMSVTGNVIPTSHLCPIADLDALNHTALSCVESFQWGGGHSSAVTSSSTGCLVSPFLHSFLY